MKKILCFAAIAILMFSICACATVSIPAGSSIALKFAYENSNIKQTLTEDEAATVIKIFNGKSYAITNDVPSCGFSPDISITIDGTEYQMARDGCGTVYVSSISKYFNISDGEWDSIESIFQKYGGYFPCV